ncbi:MAG TPA: DinB family protein [Terriglobales bacterium]|nr:DinB family protein [Terriglobales bacterium]
MGDLASSQKESDLDEPESEFFHEISAGCESMSSVPQWFERKFEFRFPLEQFPNICVRLRGTPARLEEMLGSVGRDVLVRKPNGKWSAQEHAGHLLDLEPLWSARAKDFLAEGAELTAADLNNRKTHDANYNTHALADILARFRAARLSFATDLEELRPELFGRTMLHPRLKQPMRLVDHLYFVAEHDDHHLARIWELIRKTDDRSADR